MTFRWSLSASQKGQRIALYGMRWAGKTQNVVSGGGGLEGGGLEEFEAGEEVVIVAVGPDYAGVLHLVAGGEGVAGFVLADVEAEDAAGDDGSCQGETEAEAGGADVGRSAGEIAGGAGLVDFDRPALADAEAAAAFGWRGSGLGCNVLGDGEHIRVIGTNAI
jgi:hypothetical protein